MALDYKISPDVLVLNSISFIVIAIGLLLNGFIVIANLLWWMKGEIIQTINVLITGLGLVRIALLSVNAQTTYLSITGSSVFEVNDYPEYIDVLITCMIFCNLWWSSVLCVFYCVKITNFRNIFFMRLKMKISKMVPWLLFVSLIISVLSSLPARQVMFSVHVNNSTVYGDRTRKVNIINVFIIVLASCTAPFIIFCVGISLIIVSLLRHTRNMGNRDSGFSDIQRKVHLSVIRSMISFLLLNVLYFVAYILFPITINFNSPTFSAFCSIFICAYPSLHSISLIISNKELKNSLCDILFCTWLGYLEQ